MTIHRVALMHAIFALACCRVGIPVPAVAGVETPALHAAPSAQGRNPPSREILRLRIVNDVNGEIGASFDAGRSWQTIGRVLRYTTQVNRKGYTASKWVAPGQVAATAVNAVHVNVGYNEEDDRGTVFSVLPREMPVTPGGYSSFLSPDSSIYTDIPAGQGMFGGGGAPFVGNVVFRQTDEGLIPLCDGYVPSQGDALVIIIEHPLRYPVAAEFGNRTGGPVTLAYSDGSQELLGWVVKPVQGVGRFLGALYTGIGRIRANHAGVIDISTSPVGDLGAFQIIPFAHALSPEMGSAWNLTQWMIVGPAHEGTSLWDGLTPLFYQHIRPDYLADDLYPDDWEERLLSRFLAEVDMGKGWQPFPAIRLPADPDAPLPEWAGSALVEVRKIRILFPLLARRSVDLVQAR